MKEWWNEKRENNKKWKSKENEMVLSNEINKLKNEVKNIQFQDALFIEEEKNSVLNCFNFDQIDFIHHSNDIKQKIKVDIHKWVKYLKIKIYDPFCCIFFLLKVRFIFWLNEYSKSLK
jgi:hypothetical protein